MTIDVVSGRYEALYGFLGLYSNLISNEGKNDYRTSICKEGETV